MSWKLFTFSKASQWAAHDFMLILYLKEISKDLLELWKRHESWSLFLCQLAWHLLHAVFKWREWKWIGCSVPRNRLRNRVPLCVSTDNTERQELKTFFETNCSQIYFIFYENFVTLESNLKQKGTFGIAASWTRTLALFPASAVSLQVAFRRVGFSIMLHAHEAFIWSGASNQTDPSDLPRNCDFKRNTERSAAELIEPEIRPTAEVEDHVFINRLKT